MTQMQPVQSSQVAAIGYDESNELMLVEWKSGKTSEYSGVPAHVYQSVSSSQSIGRALNQQVKGVYGHRYV